MTDTKFTSDDKYKHLQSKGGKASSRKGIPNGWTRELVNETTFKRVVNLAIKLQLDVWKVLLMKLDMLTDKGDLNREEARLFSRIIRLYFSARFKRP